MNKSEINRVLKFRIAGVRIDAVTLELAVKIIEKWISMGWKSYVCLTGAHAIVDMYKSKELFRINEESGLVTADGMPVVWVGRQRGYNLERVCASNLMPALFERSLKKKYKHYLYGSSADVIDRLKFNLSKDYPGINIVGTYSPPFRELTDFEKNHVVSIINSASPDIVWVGLGFPKQAFFMAEFSSLLNASVLIGVGAGFDFFSGNKRIAPTWISILGLEWFYRLLNEPNRLLARYARVVPMFIHLIVKDFIIRYIQAIRKSQGGRFG